MRHFIFRIGAVLIVLLALMVLTTPPATHAATNPSLGQNPLSKLGGQPLAKPANGITYDQDIVIAVANLAYPNGHIVTEGWLHLDPPKGTATVYKGYFFDNFAGKSYPSTADSTGVFTINTHLGKFLFSNNAALSLPSKFGAGASGFGISKPHLYKTVSYTFNMDAIVGFSPHISGAALSLTYDTNNFIVPTNAKMGAASTLTGVVDGKPFMATLGALAVITPGDGGNLYLTIKINGISYALYAISVNEINEPTGSFHGTTEGIGKQGTIVQWQALAA